jgi:hypothetical protein
VLLGVVVVTVVVVTVAGSLHVISDSSRAENTEDMAHRVYNPTSHTM